MGGKLIYNHISFLKSDWLFIFLFDSKTPVV